MNVAVLGADGRAREIASACVRAGESVRLCAGDATAVMDSIDTVEGELEGRLADTDVTDRLEGTTGLEAAVDDVAVVIETTTATPSVLQERFARVERHLADDALVASAVPTVSVTEAAAGLARPDRAVGFRFHGSSEPFVEVVIAEQTGSDAAERAGRFAASVGDEWITARDTPGTVSTRLALALEVAAVRMLDEGVAGVEAIDTALEQRYRAEIGPLERADRIGLESRHDAMRSLAERLGPRFEPPPLLSALVEAGNTGREAGEGFYVWTDGQPEESALADPTAPDARGQDPST